MNLSVSLFDSKDLTCKGVFFNPKIAHVGKFVVKIFLNELP